MVVNDVNINYIDFGKGQPIVLLHGWGQNIEMMQGIGNKLKNNRVIIIDLPGFGNSDEPKTVWTVDDYVLFLHDFLKKLKIDEPIIVGHSFGGKIGLLYSSKYKVKKLVCLASPFKKNIKKLTLKMKILKQLKKVPGLNKLESIAKKYIGSTDYKNASEIMRKILVDTVNYDITEEVKKIKCPTILIWGTEDQAVSINDGYELEKLIGDCALIPFEGCTHYAYLERFDQTVRIIKSFIGDVKDEN